MISVAIFGSLGCQPAVAPVALKTPTAPTVKTPSGMGDADGPARPPAATAASVDHEVWAVYYMQDAKVGYSHLTTRRIVENGQDLIHSQAVTEISLQRGQSNSRQRMEMQTWETPAGKLERFESKLKSGPGEIVTQGKRLGASMIVATNTLGRRETRAVPLAEDCSGFFAAEHSLERQPLKPGETRTVQVLIPVSNQPGQTKLTALEVEKVSIRGLEQQLLKVKQENVIGTETFTSYLWVNDRGQTIKTFDPAFSQESYRTTREIALATDDLGRIDLMVATTVPLKGELPDVKPWPKLTYLARLKDGKIAERFLSDEFQQVAAVDETTARITVTQLDLESKVNEALRGPAPTAEELAPNSLIQSDDPAVVELAHSVGTSEEDPVVLARQLAQAVHGHIRHKNYSQAFATAAEVARTREGDCTENAVLLAAVCRARKIPARVVLGLVYYPQQNGFAYHMWNEAWTGNRWLPLDATVAEKTAAQGTVGADHIKLRHASLAGESAYAVMLPLVQVVGRLELEVARVE